MSAHTGTKLTMARLDERANRAKLYAFAESNSAASTLGAAYLELDAAYRDLVEKARAVVAAVSASPATTPNPKWFADVSETTVALRAALPDEAER